MKMSKMKMGLLAIALAVCIAGASLAAYAQFYVTSAPLLVANTYAVTLEETARSLSAVAFKATVTSNGPNCVGVPVIFQYYANNVWNTYQTQTTTNGGLTFSTTGYATCTYTLTTNGDIQFQAVVDIT